ncbi:MAG TPA: FAD:protein FMN transferase [Ktedonobacterales bacterium]
MSTNEQQEALLVEQFARMMGTDVSVHLSVAPSDEEKAQQAIARCLDWLREVDRTLTRFDPQSELCQLNAAAGRWVPVSTLLFTAVEAAIAGAKASDGLFDPTLAEQMEATGYDRDFDLLERRARESQSAPLPAASTGGWRGIQLAQKGRRIFLPEGAKLDLGGIAKGWAADVAIARVLRRFRNVIVNVGGDLHLRGEKEPGELWAVGIRNPLLDHIPGSTQDRMVITFGQGGLATSGATRRWWYTGQELRHHLLDPRTGRPMKIWIHQDDEAPAITEDPARLIATATALARTGAQAEIAAKAALLRGYPAALEAVGDGWRRRPLKKGQLSQGLLADEGVALLLVLGNGEVVVSAHLEEYLEHMAGGGRLWILD